VPSAGDQHARKVVDSPGRRYIRRRHVGRGWRRLRNVCYLRIWGRFPSRRTDTSRTDLTMDEGDCAWRFSLPDRGVLTIF
jgi:hypothetical protein